MAQLKRKDPSRPFRTWVHDPDDESKLREAWWFWIEDGRAIGPYPAGVLAYDAYKAHAVALQRG